MDSVVVLPQRLNINAVNQILEQIKSIISSEDKIVLDAQSVEEIDALGLQLILSAEKTASVNKVELQIINANPQLQKILSYAGLVR